MVRRLPVIQTEEAEDEAAARRPKWQWVAIGSLIAFVLWMPLLMLASLVRASLVVRIVGGTDAVAVSAFAESASPLSHALLSAATVLPVLLSLATACALGGSLVGRFGGASRAREGAKAGLLVSGAAWSMAAGAGVLPGWVAALASLAILAATGALFGFWGGRWGEKRRPSLLGRR